MPVAGLSVSWPEGGSSKRRGGVAIRIILRRGESWRGSRWEPLRVPPPLNRLPWDIAQTEFGVQGADFVGVMATLLLGAAQTQFTVQVTDSTGGCRPTSADWRANADRFWCRLEWSRERARCGWNGTNLIAVWSTFGCSDRSVTGACWDRWRPVASKRRSWWSAPNSQIVTWSSTATSG